MAVGCLEKHPGRSLYQMGCWPHAPLIPREIMLWLIVGYFLEHQPGHQYTPERHVSSWKMGRMFQRLAAKEISPSPSLLQHLAASGKGKRLRHRTVPA